MYEFKVIKHGDAAYADVSHSMHNLRYRIFHKELKWSKGLSIDEENQEEHDQYDTSGTHYIVRINENGEVDATCRLIPTDTDYMLRDHYPDFFERQEDIPNSPYIWEISRACVSRAAKRKEIKNKEPNVLAQVLLAAMEFGLMKGAEVYTSLTTAKLYPDLLVEIIGWDSTPLGEKKNTPDDVSYALKQTVSYEMLEKIRQKHGISGPLLEGFDENIKNIREAVEYDTPPIPKDSPPPTGAAGGFHSGYNPSPFLS